MQFLSVIVQLLGALGNYGPVGKVLEVVVGLAAGLAGVSSAVVILWHGLVGLFQALALLPYVGQAFSKLANFFTVEEPKLDDFVNNKLVAILNQLSAIPLPSKPAAIAAPAALKA